jgi:hypothetical protein
MQHRSHHLAVDCGYAVYATAYDLTANAVYDLTVCDYVLTVYVTVYDRA